VTRTIDRSKLWFVQTPQTFRTDILVEAFKHVREKQVAVTDEASAVELIGREVHLVPSKLWNVKITSPDDLAFASALVKN